MRSVRLILLIHILFFFSMPGRTQNNNHRPHVETANGFIALQVGIPSRAMQEAVKNNMGNLGFGIGIEGLTNPFAWGRNKRNSPLRIGAEAGYTYYGRFISDVNINGNTGSYKTSYGIVQLNGIVQLRPAEPDVVTPFIEVLAGGSFYLSNTKENLNAIESSLGVPSFDFGGYSSASFNKGLAVGCTFGKRVADEPRFSMRVSYNWGGEIKYVIRNSLTYSNGQLYYYVGRAPVKYIMVQVGVAF